MSKKSWPFLFSEYTQHWIRLLGHTIIMGNEKIAQQTLGYKIDQLWYGINGSDNKSRKICGIRNVI